MGVIGLGDRYRRNSDKFQMIPGLGLLGGFLAGGGERRAERPEFEEDVTLGVQYAVLIITTGWNVDDLSGSDGRREFLPGLSGILNVDVLAVLAGDVIPRLRDALECIEALAAVGTERIDREESRRERCMDLTTLGE